MPFYQTAATVATACYFLAFVLLITLLALERRRSPGRTEDLENGKTGERPYRAYEATGIVGAAALCRAMLDYPGATFSPWAIYCLGAWAVLRLGLFAFKVKITFFGQSRQGGAHLAIAAASFALAGGAVVVGGPTVQSITTGPINAIFVALGWVVQATLALVLFAVLSAQGKWFGLAERAFTISTMLWFLLLAARLLAGN